MCLLAKEHSLIAGSYQGDEKLLLILILLPSSCMVRNCLLKGLDQSALLSDKEHILSESRLIIERAEAAWLSLSSKGAPSFRLRKIRIMRFMLKLKKLRTPKSSDSLSKRVEKTPSQ